MTRGYRFRPVLCVLGLLAVTSLASIASAADPTDEDRAGARAAATAGAAAIQEGRFAEAADLFQRAESLLHAPTHLLYLARAQQRLGHLVKARENYLKIAREPLAANAPKAFIDAQTSAQAEAAELEGRIPTVKVIVEGEGAADAIVTMDGQKISTALTGVPFPIDPGDHKFQARTKEMSSDEVVVTCAEGTRKTLTVSLRLSLRTEVTDAPTPTPAPAIAPPAAPSPPARDEGTSGLRIGAYAALGVGAVGLVGGTVFLLRNRSERGEANDLCATGPCPASRRAEIESHDDAASSAATLSAVGYGIGAAGLAAGAVMFLLSPAGGGSAKTGTMLRPILTGSAAGGYVGLGGAY